MLGGLGICGRPFCCNSFCGVPAGLYQDGQDPKPLPEPHQDFRHLAGSCCLKYEQEAYEDLRGRPRMDSFVETPTGQAPSSASTPLQEKVRVRWTTPRTP